MAIMERTIHDLKDHSSWDTIMVVEQKWIDAEKGLGGFPDKRYYQPLAGSDDILTFIWEREWDSLSEMEQAYEKLMNSEAAKKCIDPTKDLIASFRRELFTVKEL